MHVKLSEALSQIFCLMQMTFFGVFFWIALDKIDRGVFRTTKLLITLFVKENIKLSVLLEHIIFISEKFVIFALIC